MQTIGDTSTKMWRGFSQAIYTSVVCLFVFLAYVADAFSRVSSCLSLSNRKLRKTSMASLPQLLDSSPVIIPQSVDLSTYTPPTVGAEIWIGSIVAVIPIIWATFEFVGRIRTQRQCAVCQGNGLAYVTKSGNRLNRPRKCWNCGGFLPWLGWKMFFLSSVKDVGNGGVLRRPARDYAQTNAEWEKIKNESSNDLSHNTYADADDDE